MPLEKTPRIVPSSPMMKLERVPGLEPSCREEASWLPLSPLGRPRTLSKLKSNSSGEADGTFLRLDGHGGVGGGEEIALAVEAEQAGANGDVVSAGGPVVGGIRKPAVDSLRTGNTFEHGCDADVDGDAERVEGDEIRHRALTNRFLGGAEGEVHGVDVGARIERKCRQRNRDRVADSVV